MPKRAIQSGSFSTKEHGNVAVNSDVVYPDDHWIVKAKPEWFVDAAKHPEVVGVERLGQ
jgi:hypothetical protein